MPGTESVIEQETYTQASIGAEGPLTPDQVRELGHIAARTTLLPMFPQMLSPEERLELAGGCFGWDIIGEKVHPEVAQFIARFGGGKFDGLLKAKVQAWLMGWVTPPPYYSVHAPRVASGAWWRIFRSTLGVEPALQEADLDAQRLSESDLERRYADKLGPAARDRFPDHATWWENVRKVIRMGSWHLAVYSPALQGFVSPFGVDEDEVSDRALDRIRAEFRSPAWRLYPGAADVPEAWNLSSAIYAGDTVELFGTLIDGLPFSEPWGEGVTQTQPGSTQGWVISGVIHTHSRGNQTFTVKEEPRANAVAMDAPDPYTLAQEIFAVTGWRPRGIPLEAMEPSALNRLSTEFREQVTGKDMESYLYVPREVFLDAVHANPNLVPVYGRLLSQIRRPRQD